jgi:hypothetical protein
MSASRGILPAIAASMANSRAARNHEQKSIRLDIKKLEALCARWLGQPLGRVVTRR